MRLKLLNLQKRLEVEIEKAEKNALGSKQSANEVAGGMVASYSVAGDAEHARNSAILNQHKLNQLNKLKEEMDKALLKEIPEKAEPLCFVSVKFKNGSKNNLYLVNNPVYISDFNLVSVQSPIGKSLYDKSVGSSFSYVLSSQDYSGIILAIE